MSSSSTEKPTNAYGQDIALCDLAWDLIKQSKHWLRYASGDICKFNPFEPLSRYFGVTFNLYSTMLNLRYNNITINIDESTTEEEAFNNSKRCFHDLGSGPDHLYVTTQFDIDDDEDKCVKFYDNIFSKIYSRYVVMKKSKNQIHLDHIMDLREHMEHSIKFQKEVKYHMKWITQNMAAIMDKISFLADAVTELQTSENKDTADLSSSSEIKGLD